MHRPARPGALLILVLALLAGAVSVAGPAMAVNDVTGPAVSQPNVTPHPDNDELSYATAPAIRHLTAPTLFGLLGDAAPAPTTDQSSGGAHSRHHGPVAQEAGPGQVRAPPAITNR
ncbi:MAG TPA: hypothetical protein VE645_12700 [Pseudonocardiaceae bacterium]|nr:hypothetical protein [Pseudonocardiaceae bacterium]